jgi:hypothetical protein
MMISAAAPECPEVLNEAFPKFPLLVERLLWTFWVPALPHRFTGEAPKCITAAQGKLNERPGQIREYF